MDTLLSVPALPQPAAPVYRTRNGRPLRLINTKDLPRDEWLEVRRRGIGSSDAAAAVGLNPYLSPLALWLEKTGRTASGSRADNEATEWGTMLEPLVAAVYTKRTGRKVRRVNAVLQHPEYPWMLANIDREVLGDPDVQILECKTAGIQGARFWDNGVPEYVQLQVMHQLAVTGSHAADVAVLLGGQHLKIYRIHRDETMITRLIELEKQFWRNVETDTAPPADGSPSSDEALRHLFPRSNGTVVDLKCDADLNVVFDRLQAVREVLRTTEQEEAELRQRIEQAMGDAECAEFLNGTVYWKSTRDTVRLDIQSLRKAHPELAEQFSYTTPGSRRFVVRPL